MIVKSAAASMLLALSSPVAPAVGPFSSAPVLPGAINDGLPPERFQGNGGTVVLFTDRAGIDELCGKAQPPYQIIACTRQAANGAPVIIMPNACLAGQTEFYARIMCHEMGHVNGWSGDHED